MSPNRFGSVRRLPSGRFQARYRPVDGDPITAPTTFATAAEAEAFLEALRAQLNAPRR